MASTARFSYQRLKQEVLFDDGFEERHRFLLRSRSWCRIRKVHIKKRFKLKVPSLRRFLRRKIRLASAAWAKVFKRLKEGQGHVGDLFAGNYLFLQVVSSKNCRIASSFQSSVFVFMANAFVAVDQVNEKFLGGLLRPDFPISQFMEHPHPLIMDCHLRRYGHQDLGSSLPATLFGELKEQYRSQVAEHLYHKERAESILAQLAEEEKACLGRLSQIHQQTGTLQEIINAANHFLSDDNLAFLAFLSKST